MLSDNDSDYKYGINMLCSGIPVQGYADVSLSPI